MLSALDLPEIRSSIAQYLGPHDLCSCMLVCKLWHESFYLWRWKSVQVFGIHSVQDDVTLRRHAHIVRSISFLRILSLRHFSSLEQYSRLNRIRITGASGEGRVVWEKLAQLVEQGNGGTLRRVVVEDSLPLAVFLIALGGRRGRGKAGKDFCRRRGSWQLENESEEEETEGEDEDEFGQGSEVGTLPAIDAHTTADTATRPMSSRSSTTTLCSPMPEEQSRYLDTLVWKRIRVPVLNMDHLWEASLGAEDLVLECLTITGMEGSTIPTTTPILIPTNDDSTSLSSLSSPRPIVTCPPSQSNHIQRLRVSWIIGLSVDWQLDLWIQPCAELRSLVWEAPTFPDPLLFQFARMVEADTWPWLNSLEISSCVAPFPSDAAIARILAATSPYYSSASSTCSFSSSPPSSFGSRRQSSESSRDYTTRRLHRWERLIFRTVGFGPLAFESLRKHFGTLKTLKWIGYVGNVTNEMAREVLESCPYLEDFHAPFLWVSDFGGRSVEIQEQSEGDPQQQQCGMDQGQRHEREQEQEQRQVEERILSTHLHSTVPTTISHRSPPLQPTPSLLASDLRPWPCQGLKTLFISATSPNFFSPPLSKTEEEIIKTRLSTLEELTYYCVGSTVFSTSFRHEF